MKKSLLFFLGISSLASLVACKFKSNSEPSSKPKAVSMDEQPGASSTSARFRDRWVEASKFETLTYGPTVIDVNLKSSILNLPASILAGKPGESQIVDNTHEVCSFVIDENTAEHEWSDSKLYLVLGLRANKDGCSNKEEGDLHMQLERDTESNSETIKRYKVMGQLTAGNPTVVGFFDFVLRSDGAISKYIGNLNSLCDNSIKTCTIQKSVISSDHTILRISGIFDNARDVSRTPTSTGP